MSDDIKKCVCAYFGCLNKRQARNNEISFFKFPISKPVILNQWVQNCGNCNIFLADAESLKNRYICEKHFNKNLFYVSGGRKALQKEAIPIFWKDSKSYLLTKGPGSVTTQVDNKEIEDSENFPKRMEDKDKEIRTYSRKRLPNDNTEETVRILNTSLGGVSPTNNSPSTCPESAMKIKALKKIKAVKTKHLRMKRKTTNNIFFTKLLNEKPTSVKTFIKMQLSKRGHVWTRAEKRLALSLYHKSPSCYKFMRKNLQFSLPPVRIIQSWL